MQAEPILNKEARHRPAAAASRASLVEVVRSAREGIARPVDPGERAGEIVKRRMAASLAAGRRLLRQEFEAGGDPLAVKRGLSDLTDAVVQGCLDFALGGLYRLPNPTSGEAFAVVAVGGYGRGALAPHSDVDLLFLHPYKRTSHQEQMAEFLLYRLWDLGLKVGQSVRSVDECLKLARADLTVQTALLEARYLWGAEPLARSLHDRFRAEIVQGHESAFIEAKLAERDARHGRVGDSRNLLEPNVKEGKGGLRDLHTLMWIGRFLYDARTPEDLVRHGALTPETAGVFRRSHRFLSTVRCHLHWLTDRAEERLAFDLQTQVADAMGFRARGGASGVERFMKRYYLVARDVGALTRTVCAALDEQHRRKPRLRLPRFAFNKRQVNGFLLQDGRVGLAPGTDFGQEPIKMLELFHLAQARDLDPHPLALESLARNLRRIDGLRDDPEANRLFLEMLTSRSDPALTLTRLNEAGIMGRFIPDFGRIVAQMQHDLYHVYTTDEHTIRAIGTLSGIEAGRLKEDHPLSVALMPQTDARAELYLALLLHDVGKGRGGDHSEIGAGIARHLLPRFLLRPGGAETVEWLVRHHLVMSRYAFKRDLEDPKTVQDFVETVQSPERLRLLLLLTVCDIRAVGPGVWNGWKGQLLRELYHEAEAAMASSGSPSGRRAARVEAAKEELAKTLLGEGWEAAAVEAYVRRHDPRYWLGVDRAARLRHARLVAEADRERLPIAIDVDSEPFEARTRFTFYLPDHPGLFMQLAGALALSGVSIVDAHVFTTSDGMALDTLGCQEAETFEAVSDAARIGRIRQNVMRALSGDLSLERALAGRRSLPKRADVFKVEPRVLVNNSASRTHSLIEVNGRDRPGLLFDLAKGLKELGLVIHSAHISTYGERVVDVFYVKDVFGLKVEHPSKLRRIERTLGQTLAAG
ncbi:MAG: [protein-PII] uridylyltransferase [Geminicoccaceae bacterium]|nr:[protein-PII] uridylyltransferase [Geminicoccaceae bacterium]